MVGPAATRQAGAVAAMLAHSPDPAVVFTQLSQLLVGTFCHAAEAVITVDGVERPASTTGAQHPSVTFPVQVTWVVPGGWGLPEGGGDLGRAAVGDLGPAYAATVTCGWQDQDTDRLGAPGGPDPAVVAALELLGGYAAGVVRAARLAARIRTRQERIIQLHQGLASNRRVGAAVGMLMQARRLTDEQAFQVLRDASNTSNRRVTDIAEDLLRGVGLRR